MKLSELFEMAASEVPVVQQELIRMFSDVGILIKFTSHFEDRITDGTDRGDNISKKELLDLFNRLKKNKETLDNAKGKKVIEGVIRDHLNSLNVPFALGFNRNTGKFILTLITAMKKDKKFHTRPSDLIIDV